MSKWPITQRNDSGTKALRGEMENHKQKWEGAWLWLLGD